MLKLVLPKGSLEQATLELFEAADLGVERSSSVAYRGAISDPRIDSVRILRPQEIPAYVAEGIFDFGITGLDWVTETAAAVTELGELRYSKASSKPVRIVLAVPADSPWQSLGDLPDGVRVSTEYPELTRRFFEDSGLSADVRLSHGATEAKVPDIVDAVVDLTETGRALRAAGLRIVDTLLESYTMLIANPDSSADPRKAHAMGQINTLLQGVLDARGKVLVKMNVPSDRLDEVIAVLPSLKSPTVNELSGDAGYAVETVVATDEINILIPEVRDLGASGIIEMPITKIIP